MPSLKPHYHAAHLAGPNPNLHIAALVSLDQFAELLTAERAVEYQLTCASVYRGQLGGWDVPRMRAWAKHYGEAALETVSLLQLRDAATLDELLADPELAPLLKCFQPHMQKALALADAASLDKLRALLAERGIELGDQLK